MVGKNMSNKEKRMEEPILESNLQRAVKSTEESQTNRNYFLPGITKNYRRTCDLKSFCTITFLRIGLEMFKEQQRMLFPELLE